MTAFGEPDGHAYVLEVRETTDSLGSPCWEWSARRVVDNTRFENKIGHGKTRQKAIERGKAHIFAQERKFWNENRPWERVG